MQAGREPREANPPGSPETRRRAPLGAKGPIPHCREKPLARLAVPVPETDTGGRGEKPKARGKTLAKELGKLTP